MEALAKLLGGQLQIHTFGSQAARKASAPSDPTNHNFEHIACPSEGLVQRSFSERKGCETDLELIENGVADPSHQHHGDEDGDERSIRHVEGTLGTSWPSSV